MNRDYRKIVAWQRAHQLTLEIYKLTRTFPREEMYGVTSQLRRAAYSVPSNIVEGSGRDSEKEYLRFLDIAFSSLKETEYFLLLARDLDYMKDNDYENIRKQVNNCFAPLHGLISKIKERVQI